MNQSDIRGLVHHWWTRADIDILRHELCFLQTRIQQQSCLSKDLIYWESSTLNPVLRAYPDDKLIANPKLTAEQCQHIAKAKNINNSYIDFCQYKGRLIINYSQGNQQGTEFLAEAVYDGSVEQFVSS